MSKRKLFKLILLAIIVLLVIKIILTRPRTGEKKIDGASRKRVPAAVQPKGVIGLSVLTLGNPFFKDIADAIQHPDEIGRKTVEVIIKQMAGKELLRQSAKSASL